MTTKTEKNYSWDDVIFEFRNKEYGAYDLRKKYPARMLKSLGFTLAAIAVMVCLFTLAHKQIAITKAPPEIYQVVDLTKKPVFILPTPPAPVHHAASHSASHTEAPPVVVRETESITPRVHTVDQTPALSNPQGEISGPGAIDVPAGTATGTTAATSSPAVNTGNTRTEEITAEYPGGYAALSAFVARHLRYPAAAVEKGTQGRVVVSFTLDEKGLVQDATVLNSVGDGCDEEAVRVIKLLKFKPASQNGTNVKFRFIMPISFHLQGQE